MGAGGHFWKARVIDFIALSANAHNQEKQKDWKYKRDLFFFLMVGEKNSKLEELYFKTVHCLFVNIGNYGLC